jgi:hypothetical protein
MIAGRGKRDTGSGKRASRIVIAALALLSTAGCYEYHDGRISDLRPNTTVHVVLSAEATTSLASVIGPNATAVDGQVVSIDAKTMRLAVTQIARAIGPEEFVHDEPLDVPIKGALSISTRSFDKARTVLALGSLLAVVFGAHAATSQTGVTTVKGGVTGTTK